MEPAGILLIVSVLLVAAFILLTLSLMRLRGTARELEAALADETGARDRANLLLALASAVNSSLALEEVLNVALTHVGRIMGAVAGAMYLVRAGPRAGGPSAARAGRPDPALRPAHGRDGALPERVAGAHRGPGRPAERC